jgi:MoaA/NifB/PqqE/SkfB family radical SAM enzyme
MNVNKQKQESVLEKRKHLIITTLCNNNCTFCHAADNPDRRHRSLSELSEEMKKGIKEGFTRLIISGGDPTIHPELQNIIELGKKLGYKHVQMISNGRMFASKEFLDKCIKAGLNEITFSIHGHTKDLHDNLTSAEGSFYQTVLGIRNTLQSGIIVSSDIVLNKKNYMHFPDIVKFLFKQGIREIDVLHLIPFGNAYKNKDELFYDLDDAVKYIHEGLKFAKENGVVIWTNRMPAKYLYGFEELIQDSSKLVDEMYGRRNHFEEALSSGKKPYCYGERCCHCNMIDVCDELFEVAELLRLKKDYKSDKMKEYAQVELNKNNIKIFEDIIKKEKGKKHNKILLALPEPGLDLEKYKSVAVKLSDVASRLNLLAKKHNVELKYKDVPACIVGASRVYHSQPIIKDKWLKKDGNLDVIEFAKDLSHRNKIKSLSCKECAYDAKCKGIFQKYIQLYSFNELVPINNELLLRINLDCNQNCLFCNTYEKSENIYLKKEEAINMIENSKEDIIVFSGKEPTLSKNIKEYIKKAKESGFKSIKIQTNAIRFADGKYCNEIAKEGLTDAFVSLHSHVPSVSDRITQSEGSFKKTVEGIKNLLLEGIKVDINIVINALNYEKLKETVEYINNNFHGCRITFSFVAPVNNALKNKSIIPKISKVIPYLYKAMDYCVENKIIFSMSARCGIPACMLGGYEKYLQQERKDTRDKAHAKNCADCKHYGNCSGIWKEYGNIYGVEEFKPIQNDKNK